MNWEAIGAIAELLGALGVIVSLIYLAAQIRQNTRSACSASFQVAAAEAGQIYRVIAENSEAARVFRIGMQEPTRLDSDEMVRFVSLLASMFRGYENMFVQYQNRKVDEASWAAWRTSMVTALESPGGSCFWEARGRSFRQDFQRLVAESAPENFPEPGNRMTPSFEPAA